MANIVKYNVIMKDYDNNIYEFNDFTNLEWERYESDVGRCTFFIPHNSLKLNSSSVPNDRYSEIYLYRAGELVWSGATRVLQNTKDGVQVFGETLESLFGDYSVRYNQEYTDTTLSSIITDEYNDIASRADSIFNAKLTLGTVENPYQSNTTTDLTLSRTFFNENFLQVLKEMVLIARAEMVSGWNQNTAFGVTLSDTSPTFFFSRDNGQDKEDVVLELDSEIVGYTEVQDFRRIHNEVKGLAVIEGPQVISSKRADSTSKKSWYRREFYPFFYSVTTQTGLDQRTINFLYDHRNPPKDMRIRLAAGLKPFDGYTLGDRIKIIINRGRTQVNEFKRVVGLNVKIDDTGIEQVVPILQKVRE